ncbi:CshA/CshB family fibrillar adhesin-related protein [Bizionia paragorgiae]|uniref:Conserved repeat domain-containing protein n=1 Tax=Bizionia paragorgiae TaxID=283786 RepID=A0A1H4DFD4_BIZPA|nr:CshA/CshB family fibrillar adhesin-related protein [Bizionia paragorgiae]SEA71258.1 conserved repeat domain-containing protein [Bizionia paragorgiae]
MKTDMSFPNLTNSVKMVLAFMLCVFMSVGSVVAQDAYAVSVFSSTNIENPDNALGAPDCKVAKMEIKDKSEIILKLGGTVKPGTNIIFRFRSDNNGNGNGFGFINASTSPTFSSTNAISVKANSTSFQTENFPVSATQSGIQYVKISGDKKFQLESVTFTREMNRPSGPQCTAGAIVGTPTAGDSDGDGVNDICDLDSDNDGILDAIEKRCDQPTVANSISGSGVYQEQLYIFNWTSAVFNNGIQNGDSQTFTLPDGLTITATFSNVVNGNSYRPTDMNTWSGSKLWQMYNTGSNAEAFYGGENGDASFTIQFTATKNGLPFELDLLALDAEATNNGNESITFLTNGGNWTFLDSIGGGGVWTGIGTQTIITTDTEQSGGNSIFYSEGASSLNINVNAGGRQAFALGIYLICDTDQDGIPNYLDLDSDGDGCPDAIEGGGNFSHGDLIESNMNGGNAGGAFNGTSPSPVVYNLGVGPVNNDGVLDTVGAGQAEGTSKDPSTNNCATDLRLTKTVANAAGTIITEANVGKTIYYTITVFNESPYTIPVTDIIVKDYLPAGVTYNSGASIIPVGTTFSVTGTTGTWDLASTLLAQGASIAITIAVDIGPNCDDITNTAEIFSATPSEDIDSTPGNLQQP